MNMTKANRTRDAARTKAQILIAAQQVFSHSSYSEAGLREITLIAGVNPALVSRYFGSKEKLFAAALADILHADYLTKGGKDNFGRRLVASFIDEVPETANPLAMLVFATTDARAREIALTQLHAHLIAPLIVWFDSDDAEDRAAQLISLTAGFFVYRTLLPIEPMTKQLSPGIRSWLEKTLQAIVD